LVAKYHKTHLFQEPEWNAAPIGDVENLATFTTTFGVTFGVYICFDMLFYWPAERLVQLGVRDFAVPQWWVNQDTLQTATQAQQAWSRVNAVNLLAADSGLSLNYSGKFIIDTCANC
jgi:predicted amidohydrolase